MKKERNCLSVITLSLVLTLFCNYAIAQSSKAKPWIPPTSVNQLKNPLAQDAAAPKEGKKLYITYCAPCHGNSGKGDGIASAAVNPKPADHTSVAVQSETDGALFWKMTEGRGPMISYKQLLTETQRWQLISFIRTLGKKK
ncbi:MAG: c-type cytochrome [Chitinophagaceae bacterium]|nr:c-type cytochrome [Chitinophagaceae bacterium]